MSKHSILITGVAGLLGSNYSKYLTERNKNGNNYYNIIGIDNLSGGYKDFVETDKIKFYNIDLKELNEVEKVFLENKIDFVYHFAAYAAEGLSPFIRNYNYQNNVLSSVNIVNCCVKYNVKKLIFTSSMAVYGFGNPPFKESQQQSPIDPYGIAKYAIEMDIIQAGEQFGLNYTIIRPHNIVGKYQNIWDKYRNVIGIWCRKILNDENILIYGDGEQTRAFSDVDYYMEPFEKLISDISLGNKEIINLGADKEYKLKVIAEMIVEYAKTKGFSPKEIIHVEKRHEVKNAFCDHSKAREILNFEDGTEISSLIAKIFDWAETQPNREVKEFSSFEIEKGIYSFWKLK